MSIKNKWVWEFIKTVRQEMKYGQNKLKNRAAGLFQKHILLRRSPDSRTTMSDRAQDLRYGLRI